MDGDGHTADIAHPYRAGQGTGQGLEMVDITGVIFFIIFPKQNINSVFKIEKWCKTAIDRKKKSAKNEEHQEQGSPHHVGEICG